MVDHPYKTELYLNARNRLNKLLKVLEDGAQKASVTADKYLTKARTAMGLNYAK